MCHPAIPDIDITVYGGGGSLYTQCMHTARLAWRRAAETPIPTYLPREINNSNIQLM